MALRSSEAATRSVINATVNLSPPRRMPSRMCSSRWCVLVRQRFSQRQLKRLLSGLGERNVPPTTPAPAGLAQRVVVGTGAERPVDVFPDCVQVDAD